LIFSQDRNSLHTVDTLVSGILKKRIHGNITRKEGENNRRGTEQEKKRIETDSDNYRERMEGIRVEDKEEIIAFGVIFSLTTAPPEGP
jgi:hypothetical protein